LKQKRYNHQYCVAFSVESSDPKEATIEQLVEALSKRAEELRRNPDGEAFANLDDSYEVKE